MPISASLTSTGDHPIYKLLRREWRCRTGDCRPDAPYASARTIGVRGRGFPGPDAEWRSGRLEGYRLRFNLDGRPRGRSAPANIEPSDDDEVWGVLYRITRRQLVRLNATEGVPGCNYRPHWVDALDASDNRLRVVTYMAEGNERDGSPSLRYITLLREGARAHGLPDHWIDRLESVEHAD